MSTLAAVLTERTLATVAIIESLHPIEGADAIVRARVRGSDVAVRLDEFLAGDRILYFEVDSPLDTSQDRFSFMVPRGQWPSWLLDQAVPVHDLPFPASSDEALEQVDGMKSLVNPARPRRSSPTDTR